MKKTLRYVSMLLMTCLILSGCSKQAPSEQTTKPPASSNALQQQTNDESQEQSGHDTKQDEVDSSVTQNTGITMDKIPAYSGDAYIAIDNNVPSFTKADMTTTSFETYSQLDALGRCGTAFANIGLDLMPTEERKSIGSVKPSGWQTIKYDNVDGKYLYNRCHLIGFQLTAENANANNLITGTRYLNIEGMLPFENMIADYVKETGNHVLYRVTPIFEGNNLVASGVHMEAYSVEDEGDGISFNVYAYNVQPGITIDYATGASELGQVSQQVQKEESTTKEEIAATQTVKPSDKVEAKEETNTSGREIRGNSNSMIYHCPGQASYENMADSKHLVVFSSEQEAKNAGYRKAKR